MTELGQASGIVGPNKLARQQQRVYESYADSLRRMQIRAMSGGIFGNPPERSQIGDHAYARRSYSTPPGSAKPTSGWGPGSFPGAAAFAPEHSSAESGPGSICSS